MWNDPERVEVESYEEIERRKNRLSAVEREKELEKTGRRSARCQIDVR